MLRAYKYRLLPNEEQKQQLSNFFGGYRFVYNIALETKMHAWTYARKNLGWMDLVNQLKELKDTEATWLKECPAQALCVSIRNLDVAYTNFFKGAAGFPRFKSKHHKQSIQFPQSVQVNFNNGILSIPKLKNIPCVFHRQFKGKIKTVTVSKTPTGKYFVSILVDNQEELPKKQPVTEETTVGIDMGVKTFATLSDGTTFKNPKLLRKNLTRLRIEQRKMSRRFKRGATDQSMSYQKQKLVVAKLHECIKNQRLDYLHKVSTKIIRSYDTICLEDLNLAGLMKNHNLALSISEVGWHSFESMLKYKADWYGKNIQYIGRFEPSSKLCSHCGTIFKELCLKDRSWACQFCGTHHERDDNAAKNIKTIGLRNQPSTVNVSH